MMGGNLIDFLWNYFHKIKVFKKTYIALIFYLIPSSTIWTSTNKDWDLIRKLNLPKFLDSFTYRWYDFLYPKNLIYYTNSEVKEIIPDNKALILDSLPNWKTFSDYTLEEKKVLFSHIFQEWIATDAWFEIDKKFSWEWICLQRILTIWYHEGGFKFWIRNSDPVSWYNIWTLQIWWANSTKESTENRFNKLMIIWLNYIRNNLLMNISNDFDLNSLSDPQKELLAHIWHIYERADFSDKLFTKLADFKMKVDELIRFISIDIQWWIPNIWITVSKAEKESNLTNLIVLKAKEVWEIYKKSWWVRWIFHSMFNDLSSKISKKSS